MSRLLLIRHGQASLMRSDYDQLSPLGVEQSEALGAHLAREGVAPTRVLVGPLKRHRQTQEAAARAASEAGVTWPEAEVREGFREYPAFKLVSASLPELQARDPEVAAFVASLSEEGAPDPKRFQQIFQRVSLSWAKSDATVEGVGRWSEFRERVGAAVDAVQEDSGRGETVLVFTSGGPVAAGLGHVLGLDARRTMELTWVLENASLSELLYSSDRVSVHSFNRTPHLVGDRRTLV